MHSLRRLLFVLLPILLLFCGILSAQNTAEVRGKVKTRSGKPVVSAFVILSGSDMGQLRAATTDDTGSFVLPGITVGSYSLLVKSDGFTDFTVPSVRVSIGHVTTLDVILGSGESASSVESRVSLVESNSTQLGQVADRLLISNLPLKSRDTFDLLQLQPGVEGTVGASLFQGNDRPGVVSVSGGRARSNSYNVNGGHAGDLMVNAPAVQPSPDTIDEFRVLTHGLDAELGRNSGSVLNVITRSGTKDFHGSAYEYFRNKVLNSRGYFDNNRPDFNQNDFGATLGGPIYGNTFFFASYERRGLRRGISSEDVAVPSLLEREGNFSAGTAFAGALQDQTVADTLNARPGCSAAVAARGGAPITAGASFADILPGNVIPTACFDSTAAALLGKYVPSANFGGTYRASPLAHRRNDGVTFKVDHTFTNQQQLGIYYYGSDGYDNEPFTDFQGLGANVSGFGTSTRERFQQLNISYLWNINAKTTNEVRGTYFRQGQGKLQSPQNTSALSSTCGNVAADACFADPADARLGITPGLGANREGLPYIALSGGFSIGNNPNGSFSQAGNVYEFSDTYSRVIGARHQLKAGADVRNQRLNQLYFYNVNGSFQFTGGGPNDVGYDNVLPNYLLGLPDTFSQGSANSLDSRSTNLGLFVQDSWKLRPNVTVNYGVRWEWNTPWTDAGKRVQAFRPGQASTAFDCKLDATNPLAAAYGTTDCSPTGAAAAVFPLGLVFPGDKGVGDSLTSAYTQNFAPRLGIAWSPSVTNKFLSALTGGPGKTSIRAGWGMFYDSSEELVLSQFAAEPPYGGTTTISNIFFNTPFLAQNGTVNPNPFNGYLNPARGSAVDFSQFRPLLLYGNFPSADKRQYSEQYHLTIQRQLPGEMLFQIGYVGSQGHNLIATQDANIGNAQTCLDLNNIPGMSCGPYGADSSYYVPANAIPNGVTLHLPYGNVASVTGPNPNPITLVGLRKFSSPICQPTTGVGCPLDGVPVFGSIFTIRPVASSSYNSLQALLSKQLSRGLQFNVAYTFSKSIDDASSFEEVVNPNDPRLSRSLSLFDARHRFVFSGYWQLPKFASSSAAKYLINGWATSGILTLQSGFPIRITSTSDQELMNSYDYEAAGQPDLVKPFRILDPRKSGNYYFDPSSFAEASLGTIGTAPRTICCGPGIANVDFAVHKSLFSGERTHAQFNAEFFNVFNHTQFLSPQGDIASGEAFGQVRKARDPRIIQLAIRVEF